MRKPRLKLTETEIKKLPIGNHYDRDAPGLLIRIRASGKKTWCFNYRARQPRLLTIGYWPEMSPTTARKRVAELRARVIKGEDPFLDRKIARDAVTFEQVADRFVEEYSKPRKKSWKGDRSTLKNYVTPRWGQLPIRAITRGHAKDLLAEMPGEVFPNRVRALLSRLFKWAINEELVEVNPISGIFGTGKEKPRERLATDDEIKKVWKGENTVAKLVLVTAQRPGEVQNMVWSEIQDQTWTIPAERSKNGLPHRVHLSDLAMECLPHRIEGKDRLFYYRPQKVDVSDLKQHDMRRTAATRMAGLGIPVETIRRVLNHKEVGVTSEVYVRASFDAEKIAALEKWAEELRRILDEK